MAFNNRGHGDSLKRVFDLGARTSFVLRARHTNTIFLCGEATNAVTLPAAANLPDGWTVMFIGHHATSATLTNTTTITGAGTNELIGHTVTGPDNQNRQLQPETAGAKDSVKLHTIAARGDWVEITKIGSNFFVCGSSRITNGLPMA
jgi:hypothetical protein